MEVRASWYFWTAWHQALLASLAHAHATLPAAPQPTQDVIPDMTMWGVCTEDEASKRTMNEQLIRAFDSVFPNSVFGYREYNLNKTAVGINRVPPAGMDPRWIECMKGVMAYLGRTNRPIGFHTDLQPNNVSVGIPAGGALCGHLQPSKGLARACFSAHSPPATLLNNFPPHTTKAQVGIF